MTPSDHRTRLFKQGGSGKVGRWSKEVKSERRWLGWLASWQETEQRKQTILLNQQALVQKRASWARTPLLTNHMHRVTIQQRLKVGQEPNADWVMS